MLKLQTPQPAALCRAPIARRSSACADQYPARKGCIIRCSRTPAAGRFSARGLQQGTAAAASGSLAFEPALGGLLALHVALQVGHGRQQQQRHCTRHTQRHKVRLRITTGHTPSCTATRTLTQQHRPCLSGMHYFFVLRFAAGACTAYREPSNRRLAGNGGAYLPAISFDDDGQGDACIGRA